MFDSTKNNRGIGNPGQTKGKVHRFSSPPLSSTSRLPLPLPLPSPLHSPMQGDTELTPLTLCRPEQQRRPTGVYNQTEIHHSEIPGCINGSSRDSVMGSYFHRWKMRILLAAAMLFSSSMAVLGASRSDSVASSTWSPAIDAIRANYWSARENDLRIEELEKSFGSLIDRLPNGAVATDHPVCSQVGVGILQEKGGNAVDAAVATVLCLGIANPASSGLGGGGFMLVRSSRSHFEQNKNRKTKPPAFHDARNNYGGDDNEVEDPDYITEVIDCREVAPQKSSRDMYSDLPDSASSIGGLSIAVPGELRGLELAHARHGKLDWNEVVKPVLLLARNGVPVGKHLAKDIKGFFTKSHRPDAFPGIRKFLSVGNTTEYLRAGEILRNPALADTLEKISEQGADAFYTGKIAKNLVGDVQKAGGILTLNDMETYRPTLRTPVVADVFGYSMIGVPPPSSGGPVVIGIARFLSGYAGPFPSSIDTLFVHRMAEAMRHAFSIRMSLSDPAYNSNVTRDAVRDLVSTGYMESLRQITKDDDTLSLSKYGGPKWAQLHDGEATAEAVDAQEGDRRQRKKRRLQEKKEESYSSQNGNSDNSESNKNSYKRSRNGFDQRRKLARPFGYLEDNGTSHLSIVDKDGNAVSMTSSINNVFGSFVFSETTGVLLGNTMDDFGVPGRSNGYGLKPSEANFIVPGKTPLSSMSPTIVLRKNNVASDRVASSGNRWGDLVLILGGSGGPKIITAVVQLFLNVCLLGMALSDAIAKPRIHDQLVYHDAKVTTTEKVTLHISPSQPGLTLEVSRRTKDALLKRGHNLLDIDYTGCVQAILVDQETNTLSAVSDMRKGGTPAGY